MSRPKQIRIWVFSPEHPSGEKFPSAPFHVTFRNRRCVSPQSGPQSAEFKAGIHSRFFGLGAIALLSILCVAGGISLRLISPASAEQIDSASASVAFRAVMVEDERGDPAACGKQAAELLRQAIGTLPLKAVLISECFEDQETKAQLLAGLSSVLPSEVLFGGATYGSFTNSGCSDVDSVCLLGIAGDKIEVRPILVTELGTADLIFDEAQGLIRTRLVDAGQKLAKGLNRQSDDRLLILFADAHWPKNQFLIEGVHKVLGQEFPITGGCVNKNVGQTFVYYKGKMYQDSAVGLMLSGSIRVSLAGKHANEAPRIIATAEEAGRLAAKNVEGVPCGVLAFGCAGRRGKLDRLEDELEALQKGMQVQAPIFGCYCAGEFGPVDDPAVSSAALCGGSGWHLMITLITTE